MNIPKAPLTKEDLFWHFCDRLTKECLEHLYNYISEKGTYLNVVIPISNISRKPSDNWHFYPFNVAITVGERFVEKGWTVYFTKHKGKKDYSLFFVQNFPINYMEGFDYYVLKKVYSGLDEERAFVRE